MIILPLDLQGFPAPFGTALSELWILFQGICGLWQGEHPKCLRLTICYLYLGVTSRWVNFIMLFVFGGHLHVFCKGEDSCNILLYVFISSTGVCNCKISAYCITLYLSRLCYILTLFILVNSVFKGCFFS